MRVLRKHPTVVLAVACVVLLVGIVATGLALSSSVNSLTVDDVTTQVTDGMDELQNQLPQDAVVSAADTIRTEPCPDGGEGTLVAVERSIVTAQGFDLTGWVRELTPSFVKMCARCDFTVVSLTNRSPATSVLERPAATSSSTSISRELRLACGARMRLSSRDAITGARALSPAAAARTAAMSSCGGASFSRYPLAPASTAPRMSASES